MRVLVTGGCGFVGSHVVDAAVDACLDVRVLDTAEPPAERANRAADYLLGDVRDPAAIAAASRGADAVSHHAAMVGLGVDFSDVSDYVAHNDLGTAVLLKGLHEVGFRGRLVLASSMVVYGDGRSRCRTHGHVSPGPRRLEDLEVGNFEPCCPECGDAVVAYPVREDTAPDPRSVYAATKLHQEHLCAAFGREHDVPVAALRYHNVYGPRMPLDTPYAGVASIFCTALAAGRAPQVFEDGCQRRDFVHVLDIARANVLALTADPAPAGAFNVASGEARTVLEMAEALRSAFGPAAPRPQVTGRWRPGDVRHVVASPRRAARELGFRAAVGFADGMAELAAHLAPGMRGAR